MIELFEKYKEIADERIKPTIDDRRQFENNCKYTFISETIGGSINALKAHQKYIGSSVYKRERSFSYSDTCDRDFLNRTEENSVLFTEELYKKFQEDALKFYIEYHTKKLTENQIVSNSTCKLTNLRFEWELEMTQELIKFYKETLNSLK